MRNIVINRPLALGVKLSEVRSSLLYRFVLQLHHLLLTSVFSVGLLVLNAFNALVGSDLVERLGVVMMKTNRITVVHQLLILLHSRHTIAVIILVVLPRNHLVFLQLALFDLDVLQVVAEEMSVVDLIRRRFKEGLFAGIGYMHLAILILRVAIEVDATLDLIVRNHSLPALAQNVRKDNTRPVTPITRTLDYL